MYKFVFVNMKPGTLLSKLQYLAETEIQPLPSTSASPRPGLKKEGWFGWSQVWQGGKGRALRDSTGSDFPNDTEKLPWGRVTL